ncbi:MAG: RimK/LysX family protein [Candidatus Melainabacteria bacterium]|nr:RimK/LysX family protein [Candidatus Melainabacteria bacterium]
MAKTKEKLTIGRSERIDLPELKLYDLNAKIDTGAYGSAIHCHHIEVVKIRGKEVLRFDLLDPSHPHYEKKFFRFRNFKIKRVRNSFGQTEKRYTIQAKVKIGQRLLNTEFSLTDRSEMKYPVLIGRKFIQQGFIVDVTKRNQLSKSKRK